MSDREKLIELMEQAYFCSLENLADHLIANGVVVREKGEWVEHYNDAYGTWHYDCPFCDDGYAMKQRDLTPSHFCPNCGADMRKGENDEID